MRNLPPLKIAPPRKPLKIEPHWPSPRPAVQPVGDHMALALAGGGVRVDMLGTMHGDRCVSFLSPSQARQLLAALTTLCRSM